MKPHKNTGYDNININVVKKTYDELKTALLRSFDLLLSTGIFPDKLKMIKASPILKNGEKDILNNYQSISILPSSSKIL